MKNSSLRSILCYTLIALILFFLVVFVLYVLFTGQGELISIGEFLMQSNPYNWATAGIGLCMAISVVGAAWGIFIIGSTLLGAAVRAPRIQTKNLIGVIFCEAVAIYGIIISLIFSNRLDNAMTQQSALPRNAYYTGYSLFWSGMSVGLCNLACGIAIGVSGSATAIADAHDSKLFVKILVIGIFASAIGLFGLIVGLLESGKATKFGV